MASTTVTPASPLSVLGLWRIAPDTRLPARAERTLENLRRDSEILIGWVQAALVAVLGTLYLVSPSTSPVDAVFRPSPGRSASTPASRCCACTLPTATACRSPSSSAPWWWTSPC